MIVSRSADVWIEESSRPYNLSVNELVEAKSARRFNWNPCKIENCVARILLAVEHDEPDTLIAAAAILFILVVRGFKLKVSSVLQFAENYLSGSDVKRASWALRQTIHDDFEKHVTRYDTVKLSKPVNLTEVLAKNEKTVNIKKLK